MLSFWLVLNEIVSIEYLFHTALYSFLQELFMGDNFMFKNLLSTAAAVVLLATPVFAADTANVNTGVKTMQDLNVSDYEGVKNAVNKYLEAGKKGDSSIAKPAFYKDATIYSNDKGVISGGSIQSLYDFFDNTPAAPELKADIVLVEIVGTVAYAKLEAENWHGERYTDMFLLVKEGDEWKIITKVFHTH